MGLSMQIATLVNLKFVRGLFFLSFLFFLPRQCQRGGLAVCFAAFSFLFFILKLKRETAAPAEKQC